MGCVRMGLAEISPTNEFPNDSTHTPLIFHDFLPRGFGIMLGGTQNMSWSIDQSIGRMTIFAQRSGSEDAPATIASSRSRHRPRRDHRLSEPSRTTVTGMPMSRSLRRHRRVVGTDMWHRDASSHILQRPLLSRTSTDMTCSDDVVTRQLTRPRAGTGPGMKTPVAFGSFAACSTQRAPRRRRPGPAGSCGPRQHRAC